VGPVLQAVSPFSETEPGEWTNVLRPSSIAQLALLAVVAVTPLFASAGDPSSSLRPVVLGFALAGLLLLAAVDRRRSSGRSAAAAVAWAPAGAVAFLALLRWGDSVAAVPLIHLLFVALLFLFTMRFCATDGVLPYATLLLYVFGATAALVIFLGSRAFSPEAASYPFTDTDAAGVVAAAALVAALGLFVHHPRFGGVARYSAPRMGALTVVIIVLALALAASGSGAAFLAAAVGVIFVLHIRFAFLRAATAPGIGLVAAAVAGWAIFSPLSFWQSSAGLRLLLWRDAARLVAAHVPGGAGPGRFFVEFPRFASERSLSHPLMPSVVHSSHSIWLDAAAAGGLLLLGVLILLAAFVLIRLHILIQKEGDGRRGTFAGLFFPVVLCILVAATLDRAALGWEAGAGFVLLAGAAVALTERVGRPTTPQRRRASPAAAAVGVYLLFGMTLLAPVENHRSATALAESEKALAEDALMPALDRACVSLRHATSAEQRRRALRRIALTAYEAGLYPLAASCAHAMLETTPFYADAHRLLWHVSEAEGDSEKAAYHLERLVRYGVFAPRQHDELAHLGARLEELGKTKAAMEAKWRANRLSRTLEALNAQ